jgi:molybdopterin-guanine dinucleotide biosynthesis protein B
MHELGDAPAPTLADLLRKVSPCDLVLPEGFKSEHHPKLEIYRPALGKPALYSSDPQVIAVATDATLQGAHPPVVDLNDPRAVADLVTAKAEALEAVLARLA